MCVVRDCLKVCCLLTGDKSFAAAHRGKELPVESVSFFGVLRAHKHQLTRADYLNSDMFTLFSLASMSICSK